MADWSFQSDCVGRVLSAVSEHGSVLFVSPTGSGKTRMMSDIVLHYLVQGKRVVIYTHRKMLNRQMSDAFREMGFDVGVIASGKLRSYGSNLQIAMIHTVSLSEAAWSRFLDHADLAIIDEAHCERGGRAEKIIGRHREQGCKVIGVTATPEAQGDMYEHMVLGPSPKELRERGVLVPIDIYAPSEIDLKGVAKNSDGEYSEKSFDSRFHAVKQTVFGDIIEHWRKLNPMHLPTICFAPSVRSSKWLCEQFVANGITAEHVDANTKAIDRERIEDEWKAGKIKLVTNYGIYAEGFDYPALHCCILAQPTNVLAKYIQILGRIRRSYEGKSYAVVLDHVGNWHRFPGAADYHEWELEMPDPKDKQKRKKRTSTESGSDEVKCITCDLVYQATETANCPRCSTHKDSVKCQSCGKVFVMSKDQPGCPCGAIVMQKPRRIITAEGNLVLVDEASMKREKLPKSSTPADDKAMYMALAIARRNTEKRLRAVTVYSIAKSILGRDVRSERMPFDKDRIGLFWDVYFGEQGGWNGKTSNSETNGITGGECQEGDLSAVRGDSDEDSQRGSLLSGEYQPLLF